MLGKAPSLSGCPLPLPQCGHYDSCLTHTEVVEGGKGKRTYTAKGRPWHLGVVQLTAIIVTPICDRQKVPDCRLVDKIAQSVAGNGEEAAGR